MSKKNEKQAEVQSSLNADERKEIVKLAKAAGSSDGKLKAYALALYADGKGHQIADIVDVLVDKDGVALAKKTTTRSWLYARAKVLGLTDTESDRGNSNPVKELALADFNTSTANGEDFARVESMDADTDQVLPAQADDALSFDGKASMVEMGTELFRTFLADKIDEHWDARKPRQSLIKAVKSAARATLVAIEDGKDIAKERDLADIATEAQAIAEMDAEETENERDLVTA
jgi:hypothetical protein